MEENSREFVSEDPRKPISKGEVIILIVVSVFFLAALVLVYYVLIKNSDSGSSSDNDKPEPMTNQHNLMYQHNQRMRMYYGMK